MTECVPILDEEERVTHGWINPEKQRYDSARLVQELLGDWTLVTCWGGLHSHRGGMKVTRVEDPDEGQQVITRIATRRRQHGYDVLAIGELPDESLQEDG